MLVCKHRGGKILARSCDEAGGETAVWSCTSREARTNDPYWCSSQCDMLRKEGTLFAATSPLSLFSITRMRAYPNARPRALPL
jgi:hypothetical protein